MYASDQTVSDLDTLATRPWRSLIGIVHVATTRDGVKHADSFENIVVNSEAGHVRSWLSQELTE